VSEANDEDSSEKSVISTTAVDAVSQLDMFLPPWMNSDDISVTVTWNAVEVEN